MGFSPLYLAQGVRIFHTILIRKYKVEGWDLMEMQVSYTIWLNPRIRLNVLVYSV